VFPHLVGLSFGKRRVGWESKKISKKLPRWANIWRDGGGVIQNVR
jgi:hypothetical protein